MIPVKENIGDAVTWRYTEQLRRGELIYRVNEREEEIAARRCGGGGGGVRSDGEGENYETDYKAESPLYKMIRVFIHKPENVTLGCTIYCGKESE